ncbi:MAG: hypothetical protein RI894_293 [Bacteroidota bacterium]|jgi:outer membrane receptor protein involved in Fe transport
MLLHKFFALFVGISCFTICASFAQTLPRNPQTNLAFIVQDSTTREPLFGATILENGTTNGITTDANGRAEMTVTKTLADITVEYMGYKTQHISVSLPQKDGVTTVFLVADDADLETVTVSAVRTNSRIEDIPTRVEVLGLEEMTEENGVKPGNIMSLLGDIAGIQMQQVSATSGNTVARIQGLNGRYTQILRDGMPLFGGMSSGFSILQIPPADLKQIEIIKGSASTLYGGDAIGGIINLVSKEPTKEGELNFTINQSTLLETNLNGYCAKRFKKVGFALFAAQNYQKEVDTDNDGLSDVPNSATTVIHPKLVFYFDPTATLTLNYTTTLDRRTGGKMGLASNINYNIDSIYRVINSIARNTLDIKFKKEFDENSSLTIKVSGSSMQQEMNVKRNYFYGDQGIYYSEIAYFKKHKNMDWVFGANFNGDIFKNKTPLLPNILDYNYQTAGAFVQNTWRATDKLTIESGFRADYHSTKSFFPLPRLSFLYKFDKSFSARLNGGFGYKIPTVLNYLDLETDLPYYANSRNLQPELSQGINADINYTHRFSNKLNVTLNQSFFFTNLSRPVADSAHYNNTLTLYNAEKPLQTKGLQTYARLRYSNMELYLGYVFTDVTKLYDAYQPAPYVTPRHNFSTTFFYELEEGWRFGLESSLIAGQLDQSYQPAPNYFLLATMAQYHVGKFTFVLNGENLLDFRQNKSAKIYDGTISSPVFHKLYAPIDGRVVNLSVKINL